MYGRYAFSIVIGVVVTMSLLFLMQVLIATGKQALTKPRDRAKLEFVRVKRNEALNTEDFTPEKPPKPPETPPETPPQDMDNVDPNAPSISVAPPTVSTAGSRYRPTPGAPQGSIVGTRLMIPSVSGRRTMVACPSGPGPVKS